MAEGADHSQVVQAAQILLDSRTRLEGAPPRRLTEALLEGDPAIEPALLNLARAWSRVEMSRAMLDSLAGATGPDDQEQAAWLLKTVLADEHGEEAALRALDDGLNAPVRRWLMEGLERLALGGGIGWAELEPVVTRLAAEPEPALKVGVAGLLSVLPWRNRSADMLAAMLEDDNAQVVSAAAHTLAAHPAAARGLDPQLIQRLLQSSNAMTRASGAVLADAKKGPETKA